MSPQATGGSGSKRPFALGSLFQELADHLERQWGATAESIRASVDRRRLEPHLPEMVLFPARLERARRGARFGFVGRDSEAQLVAQAIKASHHDGLRIVAVSGDAGMGKTALAAKVASDVHVGGATVAYGCAQEHGSPPLGPWVEAIEHLVAHCPPTLLVGFPPVIAKVLAWLLPEHAQIFEDAPMPGDKQRRLGHGSLYAGGIGEGTDPSLLAEAVAQVLERIAEGCVGPLALVLDDMHWADPSSVELLGLLASVAPELSVALVLVYRPLDAGGDLVDAIRHISSSQDSQRLVRVELDGLSDIDAVDLFEQALGARLDDDAVNLAHAMRRSFRGNPFALCEVARAVSDLLVAGRGSAGSSSSGSEPVSATLGVMSTREVILEQVRHLDERVRAILAVASVAGDEIELALLEAILCMPGPAGGIEAVDAVDALCEAADLDLVVEDPDRPGWWRFRHSLIRSVIYDELDSLERQRLHLQVAQGLESVAGSSIRRHAGREAELARQWMAAVRPLDAKRAARYAKLAGDAALANLAPLDAVGWYRQALALIDLHGFSDQLGPELPLGNTSQGTEDRERCELMVCLGAAQRRAGLIEARETLLRAARTAQRIGAPDLLVAAALAFKSGHRSVFSADPERHQVVLAALESIRSHLEHGSGCSWARPHDELLLVAALAEEEAAAGDWSHAQQKAVWVLEAARKSGDDRVLVGVHSIVYPLTFDPDRAQQRLDETAAFLDAARRVGDPSALMNALDARLITAMELGDFAEACRCRTEAALVASTYRLPYVRWRQMEMHAGFMLIEGRLDEAEACAEQAHALGSGHGFSNVDAAYRAKIFGIRQAQGRSHEVVRDAESLLQRFGASPMWPALRVSITRAYCEAGLLDQARELFADELTKGFSRYCRDITWLETMTNCADNACDLAHLGAAEVLYEMLVPYAERNVYALVRCGGSVARSLGRLASLLGRSDDAVHFFEMAVEANERLGAPYWSALARVELAEHLLTLPGVTNRALCLLDEASALSLRFGFRRLGAKADAFRARGRPA